MTGYDFSFAVDLANREHWDYDRIDVERLFRLFPHGCLLAEHSGNRAGWVVVSTYGRLAWIGGLVVRSSLRGRGIGAALLEHAVKYAYELGVSTVGLYSYNESMEFYQRMGFNRDCEFENVEGVGREASVGFSTQQPRDLGEIAEFDSKYFRGNRKPLLEALHNEFSSLFILQKEREVLGYIAGKDFVDGAAEIGPWVCNEKRVEVAEQLFASELSRLRRRKISLTIPSQNSEADRIIRKFGFQVKQRVTRMFAGSVQDLPRIEGIYAAAGLDVG